MADEPAVSASRISDAHNEDGGQVEPSCLIQLDSGGKTMLPGDQKVMVAHDADSEKASRGLEPLRASNLAPDPKSSITTA